MRTQHLQMTRSVKRRAQAGFINVLLVMLAGMGALALTAVGMHAIRSAQDQQTSLHANTQAVTRAWDGVEVVRRYLDALDEDELESLHAGQLTISGLANVEATIVSSAKVDTEYRVVADVKGSGVGTNATVRVTFAVPLAGNPNPGNGDTSLTSTLQIKGDLETGGSMKITSNNANKPVNVWVDGNVTLTGDTEGFNEICATGNVSVTAGITVTNVCTNGNLTLTGAATIVNATVKGDVNHTGSSTITNLLANGNVSITNGFATTLRTKGNVEIGNANSGNAKADLVEAEGSVTWYSGNGASSLKANGDVLYYGWSPSGELVSQGNVTLGKAGDVKNLTALKNISLSTTSWAVGVQGTLTGGGDLTVTSVNSKVNLGTVKGSITIDPPHNQYQQPVNVVQNTALDISSIKAQAVSVQTVDITAPTQPTIDAYGVKSLANFVFEYVDGKMQVTVKNISGIDNGVYYLGVTKHGNNDMYGYLCKNVDADGKCANSETSTAKTICQGQSSNTSCFSYSTSTARWTINGNTMVPGVAWFAGDLYVQNGTYINTFVATGNVETGNVKVAAPNAVGYEPVCAAQPVSTFYAPWRDSSTSAYYPTQFCDKSTQRYINPSIGNIIFLAGGYSNGTFSGGIIDIGGSSTVYGTILAGDVLNTGGSTTIKGMILVGGQGTSTDSDGRKRNKWRGATGIETLTSETYTDTVPGGGGGVGPGSKLNTATVFWTSYR